MNVAHADRRAALREQMRARRAALDPDWAAGASREIRRRVANLAELDEAASVAAFFALPGEPDLDELITRLLEQGCRLYLPAYDQAARGYRLCRFGGEPVAPGRFKVREPLSPRWAPAAAPEVWLVPGVAFDRSGNRLGHGGGHYDRMLAGTPGLRVGIAFAFQVLDGIPAAAHDVHMHLLLTDQGVHRT